MLSAIGVTTAFAQSSFIYEDDIYYNPKTENEIVKQQKAKNNSVAEKNVTEIYVPSNSGSTVINTRDID